MPGAFFSVLRTTREAPGARESNEGAVPSTESPVRRPVAEFDPKPSSILLKADIDVHDAFRERQHSSVSTIRQLTRDRERGWPRAHFLTL
jgi:hypothetical protein